MNPTRRVWTFFTAVRGTLYWSTLLSSLTFISSIGLLATSGWLISNAALRPPVLTLEVAIVAVRTFALSRGIARYFERLISHNATFASLTDIRTALYTKLEELAPARIGIFRRGDMMARLVSDVDDIQNLPLRVFIPIVSATLTSIVSSVLAIFILPTAGIILAISLLIAGLLSAQAAWQSAASSEKQSAALQGELTDSMIEFFAGAADLTMLDHTRQSLNVIKATDESLTQASLSRAFAQGLGTAIITAAQGVALVAATYLGVAAVNSGNLVGVNLAVIVFIPLAAFESITAIPNAVLALARVRGSAERICEILDTQSTSSAPETTSAVIDSRLQLADVTARWPNALDTTLSSISIDVQHHTRIALVGRSGSGKSTVAAVLAKFIEPQSGLYSLGALDTATLSDEAVRSHVVVSAQDAHIFATSIAENLKIASPPATETIDDEALWNALELVELDDVVRALPEGLNTVLGDRGQTLSGGQRQRLILARMLLARADVWVLDEPTEHLDAEQADRMIARINEATEHSSLVLLTHRILDTVTMSHIYVMDNGQIRESGTPTQLESVGKAYSNLLNRERQAQHKLG